MPVRNLLFGMLFVGVVMLGCRMISQTTTAIADVGEPAPEIKATAIDGQPVTLADLHGKVVIVDFWATWCGPCRRMVPHEREMIQRLSDKPFAFIGVSADSDLDELKAVVRDERMAWPMVCDGPGGPISAAYGIEAYPTLFLIDAKGVIRHKHEGDPGQDVLEREIDQLIREAEAK